MSPLTALAQATRRRTGAASTVVYGVLVVTLHMTGVPDWVPGWVPLWR